MEPSSDRASHRVVRAESAAGVLRRGLCGRGGRLCARTSAARRYSGSLGYAGDRLYRVSRTGAAGRRGSGHLSADHGHADRAALKVVRGFSFFGVSFVYVIFEDGTDIYWARSPRARISSIAPAARLPAGVDADARTRCDRRRLGLSICRDVEGSEPGRTARDAGLVRALRARQGGGRRRGRQRRRLCQAIPGHRSIRNACAISASRCRRCAMRSAPATPTSAAAPSNSSESEYFIRGRGYLKGIDDLGNIVLKTASGTPVLLQRRRARRTWAGRAPRHHRTERRRRSRQRHRAAALRRQCARRDPQRQEAFRRNRAAACRRRSRSCRSMTART